jgi:hypothetical protein
MWTSENKNNQDAQSKSANNEPFLLAFPNNNLLSNTGLHEAAC